jgi:hypothetical protein
MVSSAVPKTRPSAPAAATAAAASGDLRPPPTIRNPPCADLAAPTSPGSTCAAAPDPASKYRNLMPIM